MTSGYTWHDIQVLEVTRQTWPIVLECQFFITILVKKKKSSNYQIFFSNNLSKYNYIVSRLQICRDFSR